jgi:hypothetical protein
MVTAPWPRTATASASAGVSFVALLVAIAANGAAQGVYAYRIAAIGSAPCVKRAIGVAPFEGGVTTVALVAACVALIGALAALALAGRGGGPGRPTLSCMAVGALLLCLIAVAFHVYPVDARDANLPTCGAAAELVIR